ncbi:MAG: mandelate racemase/muconate lactonizing enzyme family protein [Pseudomonadota bacterium]
MFIKEIHIYRKELPIKDGPYIMSDITLEQVDSTIVEIVTNTGLVGYGETCPLGAVYQPAHALGARAALRQLCPGLIGESPLAIDTAHRNMNELLNGHRYAKAALDIALWDICGKHYNVPLCTLLGGAVAPSVRTYYALGIDSPEDTARRASDKAREGFSRLQVKVGGRTIDEDIATLHQVAEAVGQRVKLVADANRAWTAADLLQVSTACRSVPLVLEQPCDSLQEIARVRAQLCHPVFIDERSESIAAMLTCIERGIADGFSLKATRLGGVSAMRTARDVCAARSLPHTCDDAWGGDIIAAACVHLGATVDPRLFEGTWIAAPYIDEHYDEKQGVRIEGGRIGVPLGPGLGVVPPAGFFGSALCSFG